VSAQEPRSRGTGGLPGVAAAEAGGRSEGHSLAGTGREGCRAAGSLYWLAPTHTPPVVVDQMTYLLAESASSNYLAEAQELCSAVTFKGAETLIAVVKEHSNLHTRQI